MIITDRLSLFLSPYLISGFSNQGCLHSVVRCYIEAGCKISIRWAYLITEANEDATKRKAKRSRHSADLKRFLGHGTGCESHHEW
jgi:hypothetical protein